MANSETLHPVLSELKLDKQGDLSSPLAVQVLNFLLETKAVTPDSVRSAHRSLSSSVSSKKVEKKERDSATTNNNNDAATTTTSEKDPPTIRTRHIALRFYYDGGAYTGLAQNVGVDSDRSIERELFLALHKAHLVTSRETSNYSRCGRTDKGVSSAGQVVALQLKSAFHPLAALTRDGPPLSNEELPKTSLDQLNVWMPPKKKKGNQSSSAFVEKEVSEYPYDKILNNLLPPDIRILGWSPVTDDFSARFSATTRTYRYFFVKRSNINIAKMEEALQSMVGTHDFRNLCRMDVEKVYNFERTIHSAEIVQEAANTTTTDDGGGGMICYFLIVGQAFLWHQIRCMASVLFLVGRGLEEPSVVRDLLDVERCPGKPSYPLADERPLVLHNCDYNNLRIGYSVPNLWNIVCQQEQQWEEFSLAAARVRNCIESLLDVTVQTSDLKEFYSSKLKQREKKKKGTNGSSAASSESVPADDIEVFSSDTVTWRQALVWLKEKGGMIPDPDKSTEFVYTRLMERSKGTTYEEKVASVQNSSKRRRRYEENVIKKRKTKEEDAAFYEHKTKQGGSAL